MFTFTKAFLNNIVEVCLKAGTAILDEYDKPFTKVIHKKDLSPVTDADLRANEIIVENLFQVEKTIPCLSEESVNCKNIFENELYWAVDPLDGTKEFLKKTGDFTVNIALIRKGSPVFGIVYAPIFDTIWIGKYDCENEMKESFCYKNTSKLKHPLANSKKISTSLPKDQINILTSRSHPSVQTKKWLNDRFSGRKVKIIQRGSSIKICLIAEGGAHIYPRFGRTCIWDTAAAHAVLAGAGGFLVDIDSYKELTYANTIYNPFFFATSLYPDSLKIVAA